MGVISGARDAWCQGIGIRLEWHLGGGGKAMGQWERYGRDLGGWSTEGQRESGGREAEESWRRKLGEGGWAWAGRQEKRRGREGK